MHDAGQKAAVPHLRIKELMGPPQKSRVSHSRRRELHVSVFIRKNCKPVVKVLTGSQYDGMPVLPEYHNEKGRVASKFTSSENIACIKNAISVLPEPRRPGPGSPIWLLQDKDPAHTAHRTQEFCANRAPRPIKLITLPTDSPDLTPCDSSFFPVVKKRWRSCTRGDSIHGRRRCRWHCSSSKTQTPTRSLIKCL